MINVTTINAKSLRTKIIGKPLLANTVQPAIYLALTMLDIIEPYGELIFPMYTATQLFTPANQLQHLDTIERGKK